MPAFSPANGPMSLTDAASNFALLAPGFPLLHWNRDVLSGKTGNLPVDQGCVDRDTDLKAEYSEM